MKVKKLHLQLAIGVLALAVLWSFWSIIRGPARPTPLAADAGQTPLLAADRPGPARSTVQRIDPASIQAPPAIEGAAGSSSARDPFLFGDEVREVKEAPIALGAEPVVRSILFSASRRLALIENRIVHVGDQVGDFRVIQIERDAVTFVAPNGERRRVVIKGVVGITSTGAYR